MSSIYQDPKSKMYMVKLSVRGKRYAQSLKTKDRRVAVTRVKSVETKLFLEFYNPIKPNNHATKDEIFERFIAHKQKQNRSPNTLNIYRKCWLNYTQKRLDKFSFEYRKMHYRHLSAIFNFAIENGLADNRFGDTAKLFFLTGMRLGEMVNLKREEVPSQIKSFCMVKQAGALRRLLSSLFENGLKWIKTLFGWDISMSHQFLSSPIYGN